MEFTAEELQKLVLMLGSKKALGAYLGLDHKQTGELWTKNNLRTSTAWLRDQPRTKQLELLGKAGSLKILARKLACSEAALRTIYLDPPTKELNWKLEFVLDQFERYRSVRTVAHMNDTHESLVRREVERWELDLTDLIDYSLGNNPNAKGRRAELEYARLRGDRVTVDRNKLEGSQARYDFDDLDHGKVNVKSSRQHRFTAQSRQGSPDFWKFSTNGHWDADTLVCLCYDRKMEHLVGVFTTRAQDAAHTKTLTVTRDMLESPDALHPGDQPRADKGPPTAGAPPTTDRNGHRGDQP